MAYEWAKNEGNLNYCEDRKRWGAQISLDDQRLTKYGKSQSECREWIKEMLTNIGQAMKYIGTQVMLEEYVLTWLDGKELSQRPQTIVQYR
jgi:hypothetical protein